MRPAPVVRVADASLGPAIAPGRRLARALARFLGTDSVRLVDVVAVAIPAAGTDVACSFPLGPHAEALAEAPWEGAGFVGMSAAAAFRMLDRLLGGAPGRPQPARALTELECRVWRAAVRSLLGVLDELGPASLGYGEPVAGTASLVGLEAVAWHLAWTEGSEEAIIRVGMDATSAARWMAAACPPPPAATADLLERVCRMPTTVPFVVGTVQTTVGNLASWEPGRVVLLDTPGDAPWQAELGPVRFTAAPASVDGQPRLLVIDRQPDETATIMTTGPRPGTGGRPDVRR